MVNAEEIHLVRWRAQRELVTLLDSDGQESLHWWVTFEQRPKKQGADPDTCKGNSPGGGGCKHRGPEVQTGVMCRKPQSQCDLREEGERKYHGNQQWKSGSQSKESLNGLWLFLWVRQETEQRKEMTYLILEAHFGDLFCGSSFGMSWKLFKPCSLRNIHLQGTLVKRKKKK